MTILATPPPSPGSEHGAGGLQQCWLVLLSWVRNILELDGRPLGHFPMFQCSVNAAANPFYCSHPEQTSVGGSGNILGWERPPESSVPSIHVGSCTSENVLRNSQLGGSTEPWEGESWGMAQMSKLISCTPRTPIKARFLGFLGVQQCPGETCSDHGLRNSPKNRRSWDSPSSAPGE